MIFKLLSWLLYLLVMAKFSMAYENEYGPDYGNEWLLYVDDNGTTHKVNITTLPTELRGLLLGKAYCYLYTRQNSDSGELLTPTTNTTTISSTYFNATNDIKAITHGWMSSASTDWIQDMKDALLDRYDVNVITVDWSEIARNPAYPWPAFSTRFVGKHLHKVLRSLMETYNVQNESVHLIGHSLGAHVMGYAGMFGGGQISRITGLDPARPLFELPLMRPGWRLDESDAKFVDIIHTCGGIYGYKNPHGTADYFPNSGKPPQPGCEGLQQIIEACSHGRSHEYFLESIQSDADFLSYPCENWKHFRDGECRSNPTLMGYHTNISYDGEFYLFTNNQSEYACGTDC